MWAAKSNGISIWRIKTSLFFSDREKPKVWRGYCRGKSPESYIGSWVLSKDINRSEDKQIMMKDSQTKFRKKKANEWLSKEYILLGLNEYGSKYITQQLKWPSEKVQWQERASQTWEKEEDLKISKRRLTSPH